MALRNSITRTNLTSMSTIIESSYLMPGAVIAGAGVQRWTSIFHILVKYSRTNRQTWFFHIACFACAFSIIGLIGIIFLYHFQHSSHDMIHASQEGVYYLIATIFNFLTSIALYSLIHSRIYAFQPIYARNYAYFLGFIWFGVFVRIATLILAILCSVEMVHKPSQAMSQCTHFQYLSMLFAFNRLTESTIYLASSWMFLGHMIQSFQLGLYETLMEIVLLYSGADHIILLGFCLYSIIASILLLVHGPSETLVHILGSIAANLVVNHLAQIWTLYTLLIDSYETSKFMVECAIKCVEVANARIFDSSVNNTPAFGNTAQQLPGVVTDVSQSQEAVELQIT